VCHITPAAGDTLASAEIAGRAGQERGKDRNHSTCCDFIINSLLGLRPQGG
jgi:hypothetical protein